MTYRPELNLNEYKIIRKLGLDESLYDFEVYKESMLVTTAIHVDLIKGEINLQLLNNACKYWTKRFILLQSKIVRKDITKINEEKYFVLLDEVNLYKFKNVELIESNDDYKFKDMIESDLVHSFDLNDGPLWRLKVIKYLNLPTRYTFIFTIHHSIGDGKNLEIAIGLLNIIGSLIENSKCEELDGQVIDSLFCVEALTNQYISKENNTFSKKFDELNRVPFHLGNPNGKYGKVDILNINENILKGLLINMKKKTNGAKLTGVLELIFCQALKETHNFFNIKEFNNLPYQYYTLVSLRDKLNLKASQMGVYSIAFESIVEDFTELEKDDNYDYIWNLGEKQSKLIHERITNDEDIKQINKGYSFIFDLENGYEFNEYPYTHVLSNIGIFKNTSSDIIKARELYFFMPSLEKRFPGILFIGVCTIDQNLCWAISFNEKFYTRNIISYLKSRLDFIIKILSV
jgi:hypothetical protein